MHLNNISKGILPLIFIVGLFKITGIDAVENQKDSSDSKQNSDYDYGEEADASNGDDSPTKSTVKPYFDSNLQTVVASHEEENITVTCSPKNFSDSRHEILWYKDGIPISTGNTAISTDKYAVDNKVRLTIFNYNKNTTGNFSCSVLPSDIRQYFAIEFSNPPENITDNSASTKNYFALGLLLTSFIIMMSSIY